MTLSFRVKQVAGSTLFGICAFGATPALAQDVTMELQDRAYTSPIWYTPGG